MFCFVLFFSEKILIGYTQCFPPQRPLGKLMFWDNKTLITELVSADYGISVYGNSISKLKDRAKLCFWVFSSGCLYMLNTSEESVCSELVPSEGSIVVVAGMRIAGDSFSPALGLTPLSRPSVANGLLLQ